MPLHNDELGVELNASDASSAPAEAASDASDVLDALLARAYTDARARAPQLSSAQAERFEVLGELGSGGMGSVLRARDRTLDRQVALKVVRPDLAGHAELRARFLREGRILSQFNHPALCALFDFVPGPPVDLLVMELVEGATLDVAAAGDVARSTRVRWLRDLAHALVIAHGAGIIHRDLKPRNVMVTCEGELKVLDFGIARSADGVATEPTETHPATRGDGVQTELGRVLGTPRYMSPEQAVGGVVTAAADVFALGRILTEVVAPRRGQPRDRALVRLAERAAARDPRERPSAADVERALTRWLEAPRRWTGRAVVAGVVLAFAGLAFRYVHDLGAERDLVLARQVQGERLIEFVVGDVAGRLEEVGPPELVTALDEQALAYFLAVDEEELSDEELRQRVEATFGVAERIRQHGRLEDARKVLDQVAGFLGQQEDLTSTEPAWLFLKGLLAFYVGQLERDAGNDVAAHAEWTRYAAIAERLAQLEPERMLHRDELAYARTNLGVLALERALSFRDDSLVEAERLFDEALDHWKARAAADPAQEHLALEVADVRAWQLELAATHGDFAEAVALARRVQERNLALLAEDRANRQLAHRAALGGLGLGKALVLAGQLGPAREALAAGLAQAELLVELDGTRTDWERTLALCHAGMTTIELEAGQPARALEHAERAFGFVEGLLATDPGNMDWRSLHGPLAVQLAEVRALRGDVAGARRALEARGVDPAGVRADDRQLGVLVEVALEHWEAPERAEGALRTALKGVRAADVRWQGERAGAALLGAMGAEVDAWRTEVCLFYRGNAGGGDG